MCRILMTLTICGLMSDSAQAQFATDRPGEQVRGFDGNALGQIQRDLQEARDLVKRLPATSNRDRLELLLTRVELSLKQLGSGGTARPVAITANDFNKLMFSLRNPAVEGDSVLEGLRAYLIWLRSSCDFEIRGEIPEALVPDVAEDEETAYVEDDESQAITEMEDVEREAVESIEVAGTGEEVGNPMDLVDLGNQPVIELEAPSLPDGRD